MSDILTWPLTPLREALHDSNGFTRQALESYITAIEAIAPIRYLLGDQRIDETLNEDDCGFKDAEWISGLGGQGKEAGCG